MHAFGPSLKGNFIDKEGRRGDEKEQVGFPCFQYEGILFRLYIIYGRKERKKVCLKL